MKWITYFPEIHNVHLTKDLGLLPFYMQQMAGYKSYLMGRFPEENYPALTGEMQGLKTIKLGEGDKWFFAEKAAINYLKENAKSIDVLNLYHLSRHTLVYGNTYKKHNPRGKLYLKLDAYTSHLSQPKAYARSKVKNAVLKQLEKKFFRAVDFISVENTQGLAIAKKTYPKLEPKLFYLPNGCNDFYLSRHFPAPFEKKNILLSVGRPGSEDKNYELILRALPHLNLSDWEMHVVGPATDEFTQKWEEAARQFPEQAAKIKFLGGMTNRNLLYEKYAEAKAFFLPSRVESFGIAFAEALYFGCLLVGHRGMSAYDDLSASGKYGLYYNDNDEKSFANTLHQAIEKSAEAHLTHKIQQHAKENFYWSAIAKRLSDKFQTS